MGEDDRSVKLATFAGGCFWCMVKPFDELPGIVSVVSGYTGGHTSNPTYEEVGTETTGHAEAVQIAFRPESFPYERLLELYWQLIDPTDDGGQFNDRGHSYRTAIFVHDEEQREIAVASKRRLEASGRFNRPILTEIVEAKTFFPAEDAHQNYYKTHRREYNLYREGSGRDEFNSRIWNTKKDQDRLRRRLTPQQYAVTQNGESEPPFDNEYWNNEREGIYVDIVNGDALFSSGDRFDSGTGWPSFSKPIDEGYIRRVADLRNGQARTAIRAKLSNSHLGYLYHDGPGSEGLHYRVNSASLRFIPRDELAKEGYERYTALFLENNNG